MPESASGFILPSMVMFSVLLILLYVPIRTFESRRYRTLAPLLVMVAIAAIGSLFVEYYDQDSLGFILLLPVPTLAIITLLPFVEPYLTINGRGLVVAAVSLAVTVVFFYYLAGVNFGGTTANIFLPFPYVFPVSGPLFLFVQTLTHYIGWLIIGGTVTGAVAFMVAITQWADLENMRVLAFVTSLVIALFIGSLFVGFFAVFLCLVLQGVRSTSPRILIPAALAVVLSTLISSLPATITLATIYLTPLPPLYDLTLHAIVLMALSAITPYPLFERHFDPRDGIVAICACSTAVAVILSIAVILAFGIPANEPVNVLSAPSIIESSTVFAIGAPLEEGLAKKLILYGSGVLLTSLAYGGVIWNRRRQNIAGAGVHASP